MTIGMNFSKYLKKKKTNKKNLNAHKQTFKPMNKKFKLIQINFKNQKIP